MSGEPSRKRARDESEEDPPKKLASVPLDEAESDQNNVVIVVDGHKFPCKKEKLSHTSHYFKKMFESSFSERDKKEIEIGGIVTAEGFKLFLDVIERNGALTDESVELALSLADFLESSVLEDRCIEFLSKESKFSKEEQFVLGDKHSSMNLLNKICSAIKDSYELHEIVPADIGSLRCNTKTIVIQKSFELHGHRKSPAPPLPQEPAVEFEAMIDEIIDQAAIVHHHGTILAEQVFLLSTHVALRKSVVAIPPHVEEHIEQDPRIPYLKYQLQKAESQIERNSIRAQIQVIDYKNYYTACELSLYNEDARDKWEKWERTTNNTIANLENYPFYINRCKRTENIAIENHPSGETTIDVLYRRITREFEGKKAPKYKLPYRPLWVHTFTSINEHWLRRSYRKRDNWQIPDSLRQIPREINFALMEKFIANMRQRFYNRRIIQILRDQEHDQPNEVADQDGQE